MNESFPPQPPPSPLEYIRYSRSPVAAVKKNLPSKTAKHSKTRDFFTRQDKIPRQGWRLPWNFVAVFGEKDPILERINPYVRPPFARSRTFLFYAAAFFSLWMAAFSSIFFFHLPNRNSIRLISIPTDQEISSDTGIISGCPLGFISLLVSHARP